MPDFGGDPSMTAELTAAMTPEGDVLRRLVGGHLHRIRQDAPEHDRAGSFPAEAFAALRKDGVLGATVPRELGGLGLASLYDLCLVLHDVAQADAAAALALHMQLSRGLTLTYEWRHGDPEASRLSESLLRGMGSGEAVVCTTVKDARTVTRLTPQDDGWLLTGRKMLASMAPIATHFVISARTEDAAGVPSSAAAVVPRSTPGLTVMESWDGLGMRASGSVDILLEKCRVPAGSVFMRGPLDRRHDAALAGQTVSSITMLGIYAGIAQAARDHTVATVRGRGALPAGSQTLIAAIDARLYSLRTTVAAALHTADHYAYRFDGDPGLRGRRMMSTFQRAKFMVNRLAPEIVNDCLTVIGGAAYTGSSPLARWYRDVRAGAFMHPFTFPDAVDYLSRVSLTADE